VCTLAWNCLDIYNPADSGKALAASKYAILGSISVLLYAFQTSHNVQLRQVLDFIIFALFPSREKSHP